jgi:hypothetical protein
LLVAPREQAVAVLAFSIKGDLIVAIDILADPEQLRRIGLPGALE